MAKYIFKLMILAAFLMSSAVQAGLLDQLKERANTAIQGSMDDVTGAVDDKVTQATDKIGEKVDDVTNTVGAKMQGATDSITKAVHGSDQRGPYGPDVIGIRLGMSMAQAESIVRKHMQVGWVMAPQGPVPYASNQVRGMPKTFIAQSGSEAVILAGNPAVSDRVLGVRRVLLFKGNAIDTAALQSKLKTKYGPPSVESGDLLWGGDRNCASYWGPLPNVAFTEGTDLFKQRPDNYMIPTLLQAVLTASVLVDPVPMAARVSAGQSDSSCGPVVQASLTPHAVEVDLADKGHLFELFDKAQAKTAPSEATKVEF